MVSASGRSAGEGRRGGVGRRREDPSVAACEWSVRHLFSTSFCPTAFHANIITTTTSTPHHLLIPPSATRRHSTPAVHSGHPDRNRTAYPSHTSPVTRDHAMAEGQQVPTFKLVLVGDGGTGKVSGLFEFARLRGD
jgi:hypothetical protein